MAAIVAEAAPGNAVTQWFGAGFAQLHPLLQSLHLHGGRLSGQATLRFGSGLAGVLGRRMARRLGVPIQAGPHRLEVEIGHDCGTLQWNRCFDGSHWVRSSFHPSGHWPDGVWLERTGPIELALAVEVVDGGWHWRTVSLRVHGLPVPRWLVPRSTAYKHIEHDRYRFHVGFGMPLLGEVFSYSGLLRSSMGTYSA
ncbi:MAG TPA: DUF4166 domain-containing protein [Lysobacter sp.]